MWLIAQLSDVLDKIPKEMGPPWWMQAAVIVIVGLLASGAFMLVFAVAKDARQTSRQFWDHIAAKDADHQSARHEFSANLREIVAPLKDMTVSVDGLTSTVTEHGKKIDKLHRKVIGVINDGDDSDG